VCYGVYSVTVGFLAVLAKQSYVTLFWSVTLGRGFSCGVRRFFRSRYSVTVEMSFPEKHSQNE
jgi:hypothetical protein